MERDDSEGENQGQFKNDEENRDHCTVCSTGGALFMCDFCPLSYHIKCLKAKEMPPPEEGDAISTKWKCPECREDGARLASRLRERKS